MRVTISSRVLDDILAHAASEPDREVCGLLLGRHDRIDAAVRARNVADDPACRFEVDPAVLFATMRRARDGEGAIVGNYHSHPTGNSAPSLTDTMMIGTAGELWLIMGRGHFGCWRATDERSFVPVELAVG